MATTVFKGTTDSSWDDAGNWDNGIPTAADDAKFDATSPNCNIDVNAVCLTLDSTGYTNTLTQDTTRTLIVSGAIVWAAGTFTGGDSGITLTALTVSGTATFDQGSGSVITTGTITMTAAGATIIQTSGTWTSTGEVFITNGTYTHSSGTFFMDAQSTRNFRADSVEFFNLTLTKTTGSTSSLNVNGSFTVAGELIASNSDNSNFTITASAARIITAKLGFSMDNTGGGTLTFGSSNVTLDMAGTVAQTLTQTAGTFSANLEISNIAGIVSPATGVNLTVGGTCLVDANTIFCSNGADITVTGVFTNNGQVTELSGDTVTAPGAGSGTFTQGAATCAGLMVAPLEEGFSRKEPFFSFYRGA